MKKILDFVIFGGLVLSLGACAAFASPPPPSTPTPTPTATLPPVTPTPRPSATPFPGPATALPPAPVLLLGDQATWRSWQDAREPDATWMSAAFDDRAWGVVRLPLTAPKIPTPPPTVPSPSSRAVYFRANWDVPEPAAWRALTLALDYGHGAIVYLNGTEIERLNLEPNAMPSDWALASHNTPADRIDISHALVALKPGRNVLAIQLHPRENNSDWRLGVQVWALPKSSAPAVVMGPVLGLIGADTVTLQAESDLPAVGVVEYRTGNDEWQRAWFPSATFHRITLTGLTAGATYQYRFGVQTEQALVWSPLGRFTTDSGANQIFRMAVWGDNRPSSGSAMPTVFGKLVGVLEQRSPFAFGVTLGDAIQTYHSSTDERTLRNRYLNYWSDLGAVTRQMPVYSVLGNHEGPDCKPCMDAYNRYSVLPSRDGDRTYYSFDYGAAHLIVLNDQQAHGNTVANFSDEQWRWLEADLAATRQAVVFVFMHMPIWHPSGEYAAYPAADSDALHQLFRKYQVTAVFAGHAHYYDYYERDGLAYVISGGAGSPLYEQQYVKAWEQHHVLAVQVGASQVFIEALLPDGKTLDRRMLAPKPRQ